MKRFNLAWLAVVLTATLVTAELTSSAVIVIVGGKVIEITQTLPGKSGLWVTPKDFTLINGFELKPQGACFKDICIPLAQNAENRLLLTIDRQVWVNATAFADKIQQAFVVDYDSDVWSFGMVPQSRKPFLQSAEAPDFVLKNRKGDAVRLSEFRGKKVFIITWASW